MPRMLALFVAGALRSWYRTLCSPWSRSKWLMLQPARGRELPATVPTRAGGDCRNSATLTQPAGSDAHSSADSATTLRRAIDFSSALAELLGLLAQPLREGHGLRGHALLGGVLPHLLGDLHRAELRPAHRAEVGDLRALGGQRLVVELARRLRVEREVELVLPAELEARLRQRVVPLAGARMALGDVGRVGGDLVGDDAVLHVLAVGQAEVLLGRDVAEHRGAEPADHRGADGGGDVVVAGGDVGGQRAEGVERRLVADLELTVHVLLDQVHRHVAGALDHDLHVVLP